MSIERLKELRPQGFNVNFDPNDGDPERVWAISWHVPHPWVAFGSTYEECLAAAIAEAKGLGLSPNEFGDLFG